MQTDMLTFKIFNSSILKQHINSTTELLDIKFLDTIVTGQVYGAHSKISYPVLFFINLQISKHTCGLKGLCILSASGSPPA